MENDNQQVIYNLKCNCGYTHFGLVRDDPSCVIDTANGYLNHLIKKHLEQSIPGCYSYEAYVSPCRTQ